MYYPIGWHKVLNLDLACGEQNATTAQACKILSVQANHERELYFILTTRSLHIWCPRPAAEIVCHRRSQESITRIGLNRSAIWKTDSSVIVVATECDQLLFFQVQRRATSASSTSFLLPGSPDETGIYRLKYDPKNVKRLLNGEPMPEPKDQAPVPALTMFSFGKLDLSSVGISCLMSAEEELIVGARNGEIYGVQWDGNVDEKFPWSLSNEVRKRNDFLVDIKFSSVLSGFGLVFRSGRVGFMPLRLEHHDKVEIGERPTVCQDTNISYLSSVSGAACAEMNHRYRLVAFGLKDSRVVVCNIDESNACLVVNHTLAPGPHRGGHNGNSVRDLGRVACLRYSPDNFALAVSWELGDFAIWSVFGSLLFFSQQWRPECGPGGTLKAAQVSSLAWGREGYNLWLCAAEDGESQATGTGHVSVGRMSGMTNGHSIGREEIGRPDSLESHRRQAAEGEEEEQGQARQEVIVMSLARCNLLTSPHQTCSADALVLMAEDKILVGPSVPQEDKFDHWITVNVPQMYLDAHYPLRYASVDRDCCNLAIAGTKGLAIYSMETRGWTTFSKRAYDESFSVCGDIIWWRDYLVAACFSFITETFEIRAYQTTTGENSLDSSHVISQPIPMEIIRMSIFENRLLVLYSDGTLGMFMLNLKRRPVPRKTRQRLSLVRSDSISSATGRPNGLPVDGQSQPSLQTQIQMQMQPQPPTPSTPRSTRSDSIISWSQPFKSPALLDRDLILQIAPIENLIISNLQPNPFCISSVALTRLHFKNSRCDDSILLNACGKLFLLEREPPPDLSAPSRTSSNLSSPDMKDLSLDSHPSDRTPNQGPETGKLTGHRQTPIQSNSILSSSSSLASSTTASANFIASAGSLKQACEETQAAPDATFKAVSVIATNVEQFWVSPEIAVAPELSYFKKSLWLSCGTNAPSKLQVWLPLLNDKDDPPTDLYVPDRIMLPIKCDIYPLAIRSSAADLIEPDDAIVLGAESDVSYRDCKLFTHFPYASVKRQCRVYLHKILRELLLSQHLGYYARKIAESCRTLPYFAHCFELLLHEVLEEEATSPVPLPDPMLPQVVKFIKEFPVYLETVVHCARKTELSMWSHLFHERAVGDPRRLFQECIELKKYDTAASCLIILQSLEKNTILTRMVRELIRSVRESAEFNYLVGDLESFLSRAELEGLRGSPRGSPES